MEIEYLKLINTDYDGDNEKMPPEEFKRKIITISRKLRGKTIDDFIRR